MIENPKGTMHYLTRYWSLKPKLIDPDRTINGDYFKKPTQYWFVNCDPKENFLFESINYVKTQKVSSATIKGVGTRKESRSMINPQYASRFIRSYIVDYDFAQDLYKQ